MFKKFLSALLVVPAVLLLAGTGLAHEFILKPSKTTLAAGENFSVEAQSAHIFMISEEAESVDTVKVSLLQGDKETAVALAEDAVVNALTGTATLPEEGSALLVGHRLPQLWSDTRKACWKATEKLWKPRGKPCSRLESMKNSPKPC